MRHAAWRTAMVRVPTNQTLTKRHCYINLNMLVRFLQADMNEVNTVLVHDSFALDLGSKMFH